MIDTVKLFLLLVLLIKAPTLWGFSVSRTDSYLQQATQKKLATTAQWLRLGHYNKTLFGSYSSALRGQFFLAKDGDKNPGAELNESIRSLFSESTASVHPQCHYLARRQWLIDNLKIDPQDILPCEKQQSWKKQLDAQGVSLIFAAADLGSASSSFGHTFLKIVSGGDQNKRDLLNYGINYAADASKSEGLLYAVKGIFGFYKGYFTMLPYHQKLREYVNLEGRDIWEYPLKLSKKETDFLIDHLLELETAWSPYYFFTDNCSKQILTVLEVVRPDLNLSGRFALAVTPIDTVKIVARYSDLIEERKFRKSLKNDYLDGYSKLGLLQKKALTVAVKDLKIPEDYELDRVERAEVYENAMKYYALRSYQTGEDFDQSKYSLSIARSKLGTVTTNTKHEAPKAPDLGHDSSGIYLGGGEQNALRFSSLKFRMTFHDITSEDSALASFSHNEMMSTELRYYDSQKRLDLYRLTVLNLLSTKPVYPLESPISWKVKLGTEPKLEPYIEAGAGYAFDYSILGKTRVVTLLSARAEPKWRGLAPEILILAKPVPRLGLATSVSYWINDQEKPVWSYNLQLGLSIYRNTEIQLVASENNHKITEWQIRLLQQFIL